MCVCARAYVFVPKISHIHTRTYIHTYIHTYTQVDEAKRKLEEKNAEVVRIEEDAKRSREALREELRKSEVCVCVHMCVYVCMYL
jgi:hypothetical protein